MLHTGYLKLTHFTQLKFCFPWSTSTISQAFRPHQPPPSLLPWVSLLESPCMMCLQYLSFWHHLSAGSCHRTDRVVKASGRKAGRSAAPAGLLPSVLLLYTCPEGWLHFQSSVLSMATHPRARAAVLRAAQEEQVFIFFVPLNLTFSCCGSPSLLCVVSKWQVSVDLLPFIASDDQEELLHPCETDANAFNPKKISQTSDSRG